MRASMRSMPRTPSKIVQVKSASVTARRLDCGVMTEVGAREGPSVLVKVATEGHVYGSHLSRSPLFSSIRFDHTPCIPFQRHVSQSRFVYNIDVLCAIVIYVVSLVDV